MKTTYTLQFEEEAPEYPRKAYQETSHTNVENFQDYQNYPETSQKYQEIPRSNGKNYAGALLPRDRVFAILSPVARSVAAQEVRNGY